MKPEERRNQLLDCAQYLFFTKGFGDTTMTDILVAAEISKGGFYHHFDSKDALLFGVLDRMAAEIFSQMGAVARNASTPALDRPHQFIHPRSDYLKAHAMRARSSFLV